MSLNSNVIKPLQYFLKIFSKHVIFTFHSIYVWILWWCNYCFDMTFWNYSVDFKEQVMYVIYAAGILKMSSLKQFLQVIHKSLSVSNNQLPNIWKAVLSKMVRNIYYYITNEVELSSQWVWHQWTWPRITTICMTWFGMKMTVIRDVPPTLSYLGGAWVGFTWSHWSDIVIFPSFHQFLIKIWAFLSLVSLKCIWNHSKGMLGRGVGMSAISGKSNITLRKWLAGFLQQMAGGSPLGPDVWVSDTGKGTLRLNFIPPVLLFPWHFPSVFPTFAIF